MRFLYILILLTILSCNKHKIFNGPNFYSDDFESIDDYEGLFPKDKSGWSFAQITREQNKIEIDTTIVHSGKHSLKFFGQASTKEIVSKCSITKQFMAFWEGDIVRMSCWYFIVGNANADWLFLFDLEEKTPIGAGPGTRIAMVEDGNLAVEHKYPNPDIFQEKENTISFPRNQWVHLEMEIKLSKKKKGYVKVWQDSQLIIDQNNWKTLPTDILYSLQGTKGGYNSIEFGITANTRDGDVTLYLDDVNVNIL